MMEKNSSNDDNIIASYDGGSPPVDHVGAFLML
jgi:hypothetical protein